MCERGVGNFFVTHSFFTSTNFFPSLHKTGIEDEISLIKGGDSMSYDGEQELMKAKLGLKFRCIICGRVHNPSKNSWRKCTPKIEKIITFYPKELKVVKDAMEVLGEKEVRKIMKRYSFYVQVYDSDFECVTIYHEIMDRVSRAYDLISYAKVALSRELRKRCGFT